MAMFDNIRQGLDFGWSNDPLAFIRLHYDKKKRTIYLMDEYYSIKTSNRQIAEWIKGKGYNDQPIIADGAEPKSIAEIKNDHNIKHIKGSKKGPDSVEFGERWLDDLEAIVIDPRRTPNGAREFENIDFATDRDGNPKNRLEDKDNHLIDGIRYALNDDMNSVRKGIKGFDKR